MIKMIITIKRRVGMSHDEFVRYQRDVHRPLLMAVPEAGRLIRRFVVSFPIPAPDYSGPDYDSVVEAWFDGMEDMNAFYSSDNFLKNVASSLVDAARIAMRDQDTRSGESAGHARLGGRWRPVRRRRRIGARPSARSSMTVHSHPSFLPLAGRLQLVHQRG